MVDPIAGSKSLDSRYESIEDEVRKLKEEIGSLTHSLRAIARDAAGIASDRVNDKLDLAADGARSAIGSTQRVVGDHPLTSVALAVGLGVLIGSIIRR